MCLRPQDRFIDLGVPEARAANAAARCSGVTKGGFNGHAVEFVTHFNDIGFVGGLVSFELCLFCGDFGNVGTHFDVFAVLMFNDLLDIVCEHFGRSSCLCSNDCVTGSSEVNKGLIL